MPPAMAPPMAWFIPSTPMDDQISQTDQWGLDFLIDKFMLYSRLRAQLTDASHKCSRVYMLHARPMHHACIIDHCFRNHSKLRFGWLGVVVPPFFYIPQACRLPSSGVERGGGACSRKGAGVGCH